MFTVKKLAISTLLTGSVLFFPAIHAVASVPQHVVKQQAGGYSAVSYTHLTLPTN